MNDMKRDTIDLENNFLQIFYKLNLGNLLKKNPNHALIVNNFEKLSNSCWEATDTELLILMEEPVEDQEFEIEYICRNLVSKSVCLKKKTLNFLKIIYLLQFLCFICIGVLVNTIWEGNNIAEFIGVAIAIGSYFLYLWFYFNWNKQKKEEIRHYLNEIKPIYQFSDYRGFYSALSVEHMIIFICVLFESVFQFLLILTVVY
ncbi:MAG: hypothetical protein ACTSWX_10920 [Promethearchaeota archaeon]